MLVLHSLLFLEEVLPVQKLRLQKGLKPTVLAIIVNHVNLKFLCHRLLANSIERRIQLYLDLALQRYMDILKNLDQSITVYEAPVVLYLLQTGIMNVLGNAVFSFLTIAQIILIALVLFTISLPFAIVVAFIAQIIKAVRKIFFVGVFGTIIIFCKLISIVPIRTT